MPKNAPNPPDSPDYIPDKSPYVQDESKIIVKESLALRWIAVADIPNLLWELNPKKHDLGITWESIVSSGYADPAKWDTNLKNRGGGQGALVYGNGRSEAVHWGWEAYQRGDWDGEIPRGIGVDEQGNWYIQCKFGLDAESEAAAADFAIAHNNITMLGGDFEDIDVWSMYDKEALAEVGKLVQGNRDFKPVAMTDDEVDALLNFLDGGKGDNGGTGEGDTKEIIHTKLAERFLIPPFSVLDARQGYWQERKRLWLSLGIQSELGRGSDITYGDSPEITGDGLNSDSNSARQKTLGAIPPNQATRLSPDYKKRIKGKTPADSGGSPLPIDRMKNGKRGEATWGQDLMKGEGNLTWVKGRSANDPDLDDTSRKNLAAGRARIKLNDATPDTSNPTSIHNVPGYYWKREKGWSDEEIMAAYIANGGGVSVSGTSIFDPVLCELAYSWFTPKDAHILDPFAGGSVRGIVASVLGRRYTGVDLRAEQIEANIIQGAELTPENPPAWIAGDSVNIQSLAPADYDFLFTCPPYSDLEIYSEDERDISNMDYPQFLQTYRQIIAESCAMLRDNRFACIVVGDIRDKRGNYRNFVSDTIQAFLDCGLSLYNEAILVTSVGSLPIRAGKQFAASRKLGKTHQNVLTFIKGDSRKATEYCGDVDIYVPDEESAELIDHSGEDDSDYGERLILS